ncbi:MAG: OmpA family protein [Ignavibacteria bacterium]|jgi:chemotaxis protein MotB|nr:OmpA family protein [Ignavibacteria bacterium]MCU7501932.1 OmpA family protein [Ignavibacteria bacterium]MCU7514722.1 OmpA family protein [Ignavibacteria bacterium]
MFQEEGDKDRYLITYADLITLLLGLFIILYAISNIDTQKYHKLMKAVGSTFGIETGISSGLESKNFALNKAHQTAGGLKNKLQNLLDENKLNNSIRLDENERGITIHILDDILFPSGTSELNDSSRTILMKIAALLKNLPNDIRVEGHTDNIPISSPSYPSNWHLSVSRALNTAYHLIKNEGLSPDKVSIVGYSEYRPVTTNSTLEGRRSNRRVDIVILNK